MKNGKYSTKKGKHPRKRLVTVLLTVLILVAACTAGTLAYLMHSTSELVNTFTPGSVPVEIVEEFENDVKEDVCFKNTGNVDAYIRAKVVFSWRDAQGNVAPFVPAIGRYSEENGEYKIESGDYIVVPGISEKWVEGADGYYYYTEPVKPWTEESNNTTDVLFKLVKYNEKEGYELHMEILASSIQADGVDASGKKPIELAWGVNIADGKVEPVSVTE